MGDPAPHTPINFVRGGANMSWSADCVKLLADAGFHPDDFGSNTYVQKRCSQARQTVSAHDRHEANGRGEKLDPPYGKGPGEPSPPNPAPRAPTPHERFLADSQSGHMTQCATQTTDRNDPCGNQVYGWNSTAAPCMPHQGSASQEGTTHCDVTRAEDRQSGAAARNGDTSDKPYPGGPPNSDAQAARIAADERERIDMATQAQRERNRPQGSQADSGPGASSSAPPPAAAGHFGKDDPRNAAAVNDPNAQVINGKTAEDCIENFKNAATEHMKNEMKNPETIAKNKAAAAGAADAKKAADNAEAEYKKTANASRGASMEVHHAMDKATDPNATDAERQAAAARLPDLEQKQAEARRANQLAEEQRDEARADQNAPRRAECRAQQGEAMNGNPPNNGPGPRTPNPNPNLPENGGGGGQTGGGGAAED